jgi:hypothetical protein
VLVLAGMPGGSAGAQGQSVTQVLDDQQIEFARGVFQRTALSPETNPVSTNPADRSGAVQLSPIGVLKPWEKVAAELPNRTAQGDNGARTDAGVVSVGNRLFVIAGSGSGNVGALDTVFSASIDQVLGNIVNHNVPATSPRYADERWLNDPLPATLLIEDEINCPVVTQPPSAARTRVAAASLTTGANTGFVYVVGGVVSEAVCGAELTTPVVQIGAVDAAGVVTWSNSAGLPSEPTFDGDTRRRGVEGARATVVRTSAGKAFLYVTGGLSAYGNELGEVLDRVEQSVFFAEINTTTGALSAWTRGPDVPVLGSSPTDDTIGIFNHTMTAITTSVNTAAGTTVKDGIVIAGGFTNSAGTEINELVYRATIDPSTGALTWDDTPAVSGEGVALASGGMSGLSSIAYNNKLYMIGGAPLGGAPVDSVQTATFDDNLEIRKIPNDTGFFIGQGTTVLPNGPRSNSGATVIDALPPPDNPTEALGSAWAFVVGGTDGGGAASPFIFRGRIGGDEANDTFRSQDGWFYSNVFDLTFEQTGSTRKNARVLSIRWSAQIDRGSNTNADLIVQFRKVLRSDPNCPNETVFSATDTWYTLDADTNSAFYSQSNTAAQPYNQVSLRDAFGSEDFVATCFQYRARFLQNGVDANNQPIAAAATSATPKLFSMNIEKIVAGNADLRVKEFNQPTVLNGRLANISASIQNLSLEGIDNTVTPTVGSATGEGGFFIGMCIARSDPGQPVPALTPPDPASVNLSQIPACVQAIYEAYTYQLPPGAVLPLESRTINGNEQQGWFKANPDFSRTYYDDLKSLFCTPGNYSVAMLVDMGNLVGESDAGEGNNLGQDVNGNQPLVHSFTTTGCTNLIALPLVHQ